MDITVAVSTEIHDWLSKMSNEMGEPIGRIIAELVEFYVEQCEKEG